MPWRVYNQVHRTPVLWGFGEFRLQTADFFLSIAGIAIAILIVFFNREHLSIFWVGPVVIAAFAYTAWAMNIVISHKDSSPQSAFAQWRRIRAQAKDYDHNNWQQ